MTWYWVLSLTFLFISLNILQIPLSIGFNSAVTTNNKFDAKYIYGSYNLTIKQKRLRSNATSDMLEDYLTPEFAQDLQTKTSQQIVQDYRTHIMLIFIQEQNLMFYSRLKQEARAVTVLR